MWGALIGDIVGSIYEVQNIKTKDFPLFQNTCKVTDDSVCTIAVADIVVNKTSPVKTLKKWGKKYQHIQNPPPFFPTFFSSGFSNWLDDPHSAPYQAHTNGAVMRISPVPFLIRDTQKAYETADIITNLTHNHPDSLKAVHAYIDCMHALFCNKNPKEILTQLEEKYGYNMHRSVDEIRLTYNKFYVSCNKSVPEAMICTLESVSFEDALRNAVSIGGDSDTIACMAGALAEARFGIPDDIKKQAMSFIPAEMNIILDKMYTNKIARTSTYIKSQKNITLKNKQLTLE